MDAKKFDKIVSAQCDTIVSVLASKSKEYASDNDRFHNFNEGAIELKLPRLKYAEALAQKHMCSIRDIINGITKNPSLPLIEEKFSDMINYLILIKAMVIEDNGLE